MLNSGQSILDNPFIALEGISYAGKTTLSHTCDVNGIKVLRELSEYCIFPGIATDAEDMKVVDKWFYNQHAKRIEEIKDSCNKNKVLMDRYFLSDLVYISARSKTYGVGDVEHYKELLIEGIEEGEILIPWFIYLSIDVDTHFERKRIDEQTSFASDEQNKRKRKPRDPFNFRNKEFFENQILFYNTFFERNNDIVLILDGKLDQNNIYKKVNKWINQLPTTIPSQIITL